MSEINGKIYRMIQDEKQPFGVENSKRTVEYFGCYYLFFFFFGLNYPSHHLPSLLTTPKLVHFFSCAFKTQEKLTFISTFTPPSIFETFF